MNKNVYFYISRVTKHNQETSVWFNVFLKHQKNSENTEVLRVKIEKYI